MEKTVIEFKAESFRKIPNPYKEDGYGFPQSYRAVVDVKNIPAELLDWMETNPRKQNTNNGVSKKIKNSLLTNKYFNLLNRGLVISADAVKFNNYDNTLSIEFVDPEVHGDVDGGHTLRSIIECRDELEPGQQFVEVELLTGVEGFFEDLAEARNTSTQVKDTAIANLRKEFELIKSILASEPFADRVNYMENDDGDIDISEVLALLYMFNIDLYPTMDSCPVYSYSSKKRCSDYYIKQMEAIEDGTLAPEDSVYYKMAPIVLDIIKLYDRLESEVGNYYMTKYPGGHYGATTGVTSAKKDKAGRTKLFKSKYYDNDIYYASPTGFLYPIIGAFRALVEVGPDGKYTWNGRDPLAILDKVGPELVATTVERSRQNGNNPNKTGKDTTLWPTLYMRVLMEKMMPTA